MDFLRLSIFSTSVFFNSLGSMATATVLFLLTQDEIKAKEIMTYKMEKFMLMDLACQTNLNVTPFKMM